MVSNDSSGPSFQNIMLLITLWTSCQPTVSTKSLKEGSIQGTVKHTIFTVHINNQDTLAKVLCNHYFYNGISSKLHLTTLILHRITAYSISSGMFLTAIQRVIVNIELSFGNHKGYFDWILQQLLWTEGYYEVYITNANKWPAHTGWHTVHDKVRVGLSTCSSCLLALTVSVVTINLTCKVLWVK